MEITIKRDHVIIIIVLFIIIWMYNTWNNKKQVQKDSEIIYLKNKDLWANQLYYQNNIAHPIIPSYQEIISEQNNKKQEKYKKKHLSHNIDIKKINEISGTENVDQIGASLNEVLMQEYNLIKPMTEFKQQIENQKNYSKFPESEITENIGMIDNDSIIQNIGSSDTDSIVQTIESNDNDSLMEELQNDVEYDNNYRSELPLIYNLNNKHNFHQKLNQEQLKLSNNPKNSKKYNKEIKNNYCDLQLPILLSVLLIGFIYWTSD